MAQVSEQHESERDSHLERNECEIFSHLEKQTKQIQSLDSKAFKQKNCLTRFRQQLIKLSHEKKVINCGGLFWRPYSSILDGHHKYTSTDSQPVLASKFSQAQRKQEQRLQHERSAELLSKSRGKRKSSIRINPLWWMTGVRVDCRNEKVLERKVTA